MKGKKKFVSDILFRTRLLDLLRPLARHTLIIFNYHRIRRDDQTTENAFDDGVFGPTISVFEKQMEWISGRFKIVNEADLIQFAREATLPSEPVAAITFDDGYVDNYTRAYPVLRRLEVPAIFFIPSETITERKLGWWDIIAHLVKHSTESTVRFKGNVFHPVAEPEPMINYFKKCMLREDAAEIQQLIAELASLCNVALPSRELQHRELMTWDQIREMSQNGIAIGSHTHSHRVLATLHPDDQRNELTRSKKEIEQYAGLEVRTLSFPFGGCQHFTATTQKLVAECGYELAFSFNTGVNRRRLKDRYDIKRFSAHKDLSLLAATSVLPEIFLW